MRRGPWDRYSSLKVALMMRAKEVGMIHVWDENENIEMSTYWGRFRLWVVQNVVLRLG
jgi:hypothetical protein